MSDDRPPRPRHIGLERQSGADAGHDPCGRPPLPGPDGRRVLAVGSVKGPVIRISARLGDFRVSGTRPEAARHDDAGEGEQ